MLVSHLLLAFSWVIYYALHSLLAHLPVKDWFHARLGPAFKYYRLAYSLLALLLLVPPLYLLFTMETIPFWPLKLWTGAPAALLTGLGLAGILICLKSYIGSPEGFRDLFYEGIRPQLQVNGLHRYVRHPLYLSTFMFAGGIFLFFPSLASLISYLLMISYVLLAIPLEEKKLIGMYGEEYLRYKERVPGIFPRAVSSE